MITIKIGSLDFKFFPAYRENLGNRVIVEKSIGNLLSDMYGYGKVYCNLILSRDGEDYTIIISTTSSHSFSAPFTDELYSHICLEVFNVKHLEKTQENKLYTSIYIPDLDNMFEQKTRPYGSYLPKIELPYYTIAKLNNLRFTGYRVRVDDFFGEKETFLRNSVGKLSLHSVWVDKRGIATKEWLSNVSTRNMKIKRERGYFEFYLPCTY